VKALAGTVQRDYAYDVFWVVFPLVDEKGQAILPESASEAELIVAIYNKQGKVTWQIPDSIHKKSRAGFNKRVDRKVDGFKKALYEHPQEVFCETFTECTSLSQFIRSGPHFRSCLAVFIFYP